MELLSFVMPNFADPQIWISLLTLTFLEVVLGVDNIIFVSILSDKLPVHQQRKARNIGLGFAMLFRVALLFAISWLIGLNEAVITLDWFSDPKLENAPLALSWKDIILLCGGLFLIVKSTMEIHHKMQADVEEKKSQSKASSMMAMVIAQIIMVDIVFSLDSILTAVGLVENVAIMIIAVIISMAIMMLFAGTVSRIINTHPSLQMLALSFLVVIGVLLVAEGIHQHISKNIIYSCLAFSLTVELLNIKLRKKQEQKKLMATSEERNIEN
ncbi:MAG: TerC family protein [Flavobacteriaceae bacterium]|nr:TerC family protein [Flavobacteriaceae bacterium]